MTTVVFTFHGIGPPPLGIEEKEWPYWISVDRFDEILRLISDCDNRRVVSITFDDGNKSDAIHALPLLDKYGLLGTFFICAGFVGMPNYLSGLDIHRLVTAGMRIGTHGLDHHRWTKLSANELGREIAVSVNILSTLCNQNIYEAAVPFGEYNKVVLRNVFCAGIQRVFTSDGGIVPSAWRVVPRNTVRADTPLEYMAQLIDSARSPKMYAKAIAKRLYRVMTT